MDQDGNGLHTHMPSAVCACVLAPYFGAWSHPSWLPAGQSEYCELTAGQRVQIAVLMCNLAMSASSTRTQLTDAEEGRKEMRKEQLALRTKLRRC